MTAFQALIETSALAQIIDQPHVKILDATYFIPPTTRNAFTEFKERYLPGAQFFDIDRVADTDTTLPHMLPSAKVFEQRVGAMGIGNQHHVVIYDTHGIMSAPRVWWMFRYFGHQQVSVLNGGLPKWEQERRPLESGLSVPIPAEFRATVNPLLVKNLQAMQANLSQTQFQVLDVRSRGRFSGQEPEPRAGLRSGHIPGSLNLPWSELLNPEDKSLLSLPALRAQFEQSGLQLNQPIVCSCGSGVTACMGAFGLFLLGYDNVAVYDGAWAEWSAAANLPVETNQPVQA